MPPRKPDTRLASTFVTIQHSKPSPSINPSTNKLPEPLNVCIIGASRGIGAGIAEAYAKALPQGSTLVLAARKSSASKVAIVQERAKGINTGIIIHSLPIDITDNESVTHFGQDLKPLVPKLDILILNSGYSGPVVLKVTDGCPQDFQDVFDTRLVELLGEQYGREEDGGLISVVVHPGSVLTEMADKTTPDSYRSYLTDDVGLCGAFCVWLSQERRAWLNGRLVSAKLDVDELLARKMEVEGGDLLKLGFRVDDVSSA
ncbi:NAD(P)-binding protein [Byssothecium circinans]|uniref:NAD(P)-binding protein n=1 Tax=Byssothecium circinans TaxID=147558 RepID=A0A6A5TLS0_9PLEO|nr:NAD(P)-binding protein [Byssothecium circinans]